MEGDFMSSIVQTIGVRWQHEPRLQAIVEGNDNCRQITKEALALAESLYTDLAAGKCHLAPAHKGHDQLHLEWVEKNLATILFNLLPEEDTHFFRPTPLETALLLSTVWLHGIGMLQGIFYKRPDGLESSPDEKPSESIDWRRYDSRTNEYIRSYWQQFCNWNQWQRDLLCQLCKCHRLDVDLSSLPKRAGGSNGDGVRLRALASLFRLADVCDAREQHIHTDLSAAIYPMLTLEERKERCGVARLIGGINFHHGSGEVRPFWSIPEKARYGSLEVDFEPSIRHFARTMDGALNGIAPHLSEYINTHFHSVNPVINRVAVDISAPDDHFLDMWLDLLTAVTSASEAAGMVALSLRTIAEKRKRVSNRDIMQIVKQAIELHPYNALVYRLVNEVDDLLDNLARELNESQCWEPFVAHLSEYLRKREQASQLVASRAATVVERQGTVVVYGYSQNVTEFLLHFSDGDQRVVIAIPCNRRDPHLFSEHENYKLQQILKNAGLRFEERTVLELPALVDVSRGAVTALLGARAIFQDGSVVATVGNTGVAAVARSCGARVVVLAEPEKYHPGERIEKSIRDRMRRQSDSLTSSDRSTTPIVVDLLRPDKYDLIVGPENGPIPGAGTGGSNRTSKPPRR
jgi:translation initiation factor 2B subunit (eIF-2B alpha/beta/delta family)